MTDKDIEYIKKLKALHEILAELTEADYDSFGVSLYKNEKEIYKFNIESKSFEVAKKGLIHQLKCRQSDLMREFKKS